MTLVPRAEHRFTHLPQVGELRKAGVIAREDSSAFAALSFKAALSNIPGGGTYEAFLYDPFEPGSLVDNGISVCHAWNDVAGLDNTRTLFIEVRRVSGPPTDQLYTLTLLWNSGSCPP